MTLVGHPGPNRNDGITAMVVRICFTIRFVFSLNELLCTLPIYRGNRCVQNVKKKDSVCVCRRHVWILNSPRRAPDLWSCSLVGVLPHS